MDWTKMGAIGSWGCFIFTMLLFAFQIWPIPQIFAHKTGGEILRTSPKGSKLIVIFLILGFILSGFSLYKAYSSPVQENMQSATNLITTTPKQNEKGTMGEALGRGSEEEQNYPSPQKQSKPPNYDFVANIKSMGSCKTPGDKENSTELGFSVELFRKAAPIGLGNYQLVINGNANNPIDALVLQPSMEGRQIIISPTAGTLTNSIEESLQYITQQEDWKGKNPIYGSLGFVVHKNCKNLLQEKTKFMIQFNNVKNPHGTPYKSNEYEYSLISGNPCSQECRYIKQKK